MKKKTILFIFLALVAVGIVALAMVWNKPHNTVDNKEGQAITSEALSEAFIANEQQANAAYLNKILEVTGTAEEVTKNQDNNTVILLRSEDPLSGVQCTMKDAADIKQGETVTIKGFCNGYTTVVLLSDCVKVK